MFLPVLLLTKTIYAKNNCNKNNDHNLMAFVHSNPHPGGRLNKKDSLTRYGDSHVKDKTS